MIKDGATLEAQVIVLIIQGAEAGVLIIRGAEVLAAAGAIVPGAGAILPGENIHVGLHLCLLLGLLLSVHPQDHLLGLFQDPGLVPVLHCHLLVAQGDADEAGAGAYLDPFHLR